MSQLSGALQSVLPSLYSFWFKHLANESDFVLPDFKAIGVWFTQSDELDAACSVKYGDTLKVIESLKPTTEQLIEAANLSAPRDWLSLILLLDQMPRNIYRGPASAKVFTIFDPLALGVAKAAIDKGVPSSPECKYRLAEQIFFYLPLQHSEDLVMQDMGLEKYQGLVDLVKECSSPTEAAGEQAKEFEILTNNREGAIKFGEGVLGFSKKHRDIIEQFGRFPHRNGPLGREPTSAETKYLEEGGETFSRKAGDPQES